MQAVVRGRLERRMLTDQMQAAIRIQSVLRGRVERRKLLAERERAETNRKALVRLVNREGVKTRSRLGVLEAGDRRRRALLAADAAVGEVD